MPSFTDQLQREVILQQIPKRIISVVPSQTELLFYLGLDKEIIGITKFCIHPKDKFESKVKVGGTKQLNIGLIKELQPDLIIANKEENDQTQVEELMNICPVWISNIQDLTGALEMIECVGEMTGKTVKAKSLQLAISAKFNNLIKINRELSVAYLIWRKPYMAAGKQTYINNLLELCGFKNAFTIERYPEITAEMLINADPDVVMLSSEPYPFAARHVTELKILLPNAQIILVDGEMFSWYGNRLLQAADYFSGLIKLLTYSRQ